MQDAWLCIFAIFLALAAGDFVIFLLTADYRNFLFSAGGTSAVLRRCVPDIALAVMYTVVLVQIRRGVFPWRAGLAHGIVYVLLSARFGIAWTDPSLFPVLTSSRAYVAAAGIVLIALALNIFLVFSAARFGKVNGVR
jgi:hypothetical protein